ncbi:HpcH/HpaI aldolase family protein [Terriglobus roseus]|uniref:2-dehydro-3-deoxyglucarate aldolase/4-hydroxy-2-oxoheptanedioate aldolase n=1 Tax=Terriglobus roseus TaxID=392734 RepID=A0A1G7NF57_9BACT|nr:aldolase/citrate lyase family protein [Terriglobus roseus]SDF72745.1 2-dehydro-3-deoxyglucarate aldolase/4-hydroxy-2-oxoheptanedioate aldolase [Terriglobus roseus]
MANEYAPDRHPSSNDTWSVVRERLKAGEFVLGMTVTSNNVETAAHAATLGFHFLWCEMEHSSLSLESLRTMVLATRGLPAPVFARVPWPEVWLAKRVLDQGVQGVIFPFVSDVERAQKAVHGCHYPPFGRRGSGAGLAVATWPAPGSYYDSADANILVVCVIEEAEAVDRIEEIAAMPGIDVIFIGVSDLSFSLGLRGRQDEPLLEEAITKIVAAAQRNGKWLGRPAGSAEDVRRFGEQGFQFFQSLTELGLMKLGAKALLEPLGIKDKPQEQTTFY